MFRLPPKELIVNNDSQVVLLTKDGDTTVEAAEFSAAGDRIVIEGFHSFNYEDVVAIPNSEGALTKMIVTDAAAAVKQVSTFTAVANPVAAKTAYRFRMLYREQARESVEFQREDIIKRFQVTVDASAANTAVATQIAAEINGDPTMPCTATVSTNVVTITMKEAGYSMDLYADLGAHVITTPAKTGINTYDQLKNKQWAVNVDHDRNLEYYPVKGATYKSYYFSTKADRSDIGGQMVVGQDITNKTRFRLYVNKVTAAGTITAMDALVALANA